MSFISVFYLLFLAAVAFVYYRLPEKPRVFWLLGASWFFYLTWQPAFLLVLIAVTGAAFFCGRKIENSTEKTSKKRRLAASVVILLLPLVFFKYFNFLNENLAKVLAVFNAQNPIFNQPYLIPLGISFFTFQAISYVADIYRGYLKPEKNFAKFALYMAFFPTVLAGPIERAKSILPQLNRKIEFDPQNVRAGLQLILWGIFKKVVLADRMLDFMKKVYAEPQNYDGIFIYAAVMFAVFQLFCDFSAYSDIAVGAARILGIKLTKNFDDRVYAAPSRTIFWQGWHRSLTSWLRDYVFFPLSRGAKNRGRMYLNLLVVYLLVGVWHGATWGFIIWGIFNGLWLIGETATKNFRERFFARLGVDTNGGWYNFAGWLVTIHTGALFGVFFRTDTFQAGVNVLANLGNSNADLLSRTEARTCLLTIFFLILMDLINRKIPPNENFDAFIGRQNAFVRWTIYIVLAQLIIRYLHVFEEAGFMYFNF